MAMATGVFANSAPVARPLSISGIAEEFSGRLDHLSELLGALRAHGDAMLGPVPETANSGSLRSVPEGALSLLAAQRDRLDALVGELTAAVTRIGSGI